MGTKPGVASGYHEGPAAVVGDIPTRTRKITNHMFPGPDYSVIHPGIFPHNSKASKLTSISKWVQFDQAAGWGDPDGEFEKTVKDTDFEFPSAWRSKNKRARARKIIEENCELLDRIEVDRLTILQEGFRLGEVVVEKADPNEIAFRVKVENGTDGHGVPTGFDAERIVFLDVEVHDRNGELVFASGDRDPNGDLRDLHSLYVHDGELPLDRHLFSLQSRFLTRNLRGTEREQVLPINVSVDPLPFLRPETRPTGIYGRPRGVRKHKQIILPAQHRWAHYAFSGDESGSGGPYTAKIELVAQMVPVNLIAEISFMGFEYGMSAREVADRVIAGAQVLWRHTLTLEAGSTHSASAERTRPKGALQCRGI
jgi:hypothetical protein